MQTPEEKREKAREATRRWRAANRDRANALARVSNKKWREENREAHRTRAKEYKAKNLERYKENHARWRAENREHLREFTRKQYYRLKYGMTQEERDQMLADQGGCCKICQSDDPGSKRGWHIDHCHDKGHVRGILCQRCNHALGLVKDDPKILERMIAYLKEASCR
jgi:hypothetical protein